jgi:hypothetical protein
MSLLTLQLGASVDARGSEREPAADATATTTTAMYPEQLYLGERLSLYVEENRALG